MAGHREAALLGGPLRGVTGNEQQELSYPWSPASCSWLCPEPRSSLSADMGLSFAAPHVVGGLHETQRDATSSSMSAELMRGVPCGLLAGGAPQHSLHLSALVQLVKEIPEFLFGEVSPESGGASMDGEGASPEGESTAGGPSASHRQVQAVGSAVRLPGPCQALGGVAPLHEPGQRACPLSAWIVVRQQLLTLLYWLCLASSTPLGPPSWRALRGGRGQPCSVDERPGPPSLQSSCLTRLSLLPQALLAGTLTSSGVCPQQPQPVGFL